MSRRAVGKKRGHKPIRTCVGCGEKVFKGRLTRLVLGRGGLIEVDPLHTSPGRGAYICSHAPCRSGLATNRRLGRTLRLEGAMHFSPCFEDELTRYVPTTSTWAGSSPPSPVGDSRNG